MIYTIVGTDVAKRTKGLLELKKIGEPSVHLYEEHIYSLPIYIEQSSLFGEKVVVMLISVLENSKAKEEVYERLKEMKESQNIFIIDEPFADAHQVTKLTKVSTEFFDARGEKKKERDMFLIATLFAKRDKKALWEAWMDIRNFESGEAVQGILWWKFVEIWKGAKSGSLSKFTESECEEIGKKLLEAPIKAHRGEGDLKVYLEEILLMV